jgi:omega-6 fatty acid desaturase (delta-12 desaturase)
MSATLEHHDRTGVLSSPKELLEALAAYRHPNRWRSIAEIAVTLVPFVALWTAAWAALSIGYWATLLFVVPAAFFLVRLFLIQHDCGHGSFFRRKLTNDWVGRCLGVLTLTPYEVWRRSHAVHHATSGNLEHRGTGDIKTLTVAEYRALGPWRRLAYRLYRHPLVMFVIGPSYIFLLQQRVPPSWWAAEPRHWASVMGTNLAVAVAAGGMIWLLGVGPFLMVHLPIVAIASSIGVWLFYVQHQFEDTFWEHNPDWTLHEAALLGASHYDLPRPLRWLTANIGVHHVHHLYSRIPFYRLQEVLRDRPELANIRRLTIRESIASVPLCLWDEDKRRLVTFREALAA